MSVRSIHRSLRRGRQPERFLKIRSPIDDLDVAAKLCLLGSASKRHNISGEICNAMSFTSWSSTLVCGVSNPVFVPPSPSIYSVVFCRRRPWLSRFGKVLIAPQQHRWLCGCPGFRCPSLSTTMEGWLYANEW